MPTTASAPKRGFSLLAVLKSDFTRFTQLFLIRAGTSADDIPNAGEKIAENIGALKWLRLVTTAILHDALSFQRWAVENCIVNLPG